MSRFWLFWLLTCLSLELLFIAAKIGDLARLIVQVGSFSLLLKYIGLQLILLFPIASAGSCLVSVMSVTRELSSTMQLTAWRSIGVSLRLILMPLIASSLFLSCINLTALAHVVPLAYRKAKTLATEQMRKEPLSQLKGAQTQNSGLFIHSSPSSTSDHIKDLWLIGAVRGKSQLMHVSRLKELGSSTIASHVDMLSYLPSSLDKESHFDHLIHEHYNKLVAPANWLQSTLEAPPSSTSISSAPLNELFKNKKWTEEIIRRAAWGLSPLVFALFGFVFGLQSHRRRAPLWQRGVTTLALASFLIALFVIRKLPGEAPFLLMITLSTYILAMVPLLWRLRRYSRGKS